MIQRETRIQTNLEVAVRRPNEAHLGAGRVRNISRQGLLLEGGESYRKGDAIAVEIPATHDRGRVLVLGEVAWADRDRKGMRFEGMLPHHRARLQEMLTEMAAA
jgi:hypothetical protein